MNNNKDLLSSLDSLLLKLTPEPILKKANQIITNPNLTAQIKIVNYSGISAGIGLTIYGAITSDLHLASAGIFTATSFSLSEYARRQYKPYN